MASDCVVLNGYNVPLQHVPVWRRVEVNWQNVFRVQKKPLPYIGVVRMADSNLFNATAWSCPLRIVVEWLQFQRQLWVWGFQGAEQWIVLAANQLMYSRGRSCHLRSTSNKLDSDSWSCCWSCPFVGCKLLLTPCMPRLISMHSIWWMCCRIRLPLNFFAAEGHVESMH